MMKKLVLMLMLVLGLAATANAITGISIQVAGPYSDISYVPGQAEYRDATDVTLVPCQYLWIGLYNSILGVPGAQQKGNFILGTVEPSPDISWTGNWVLYQPPLVGPDSKVYNEYCGLYEMGDGTIVDEWDIFLTDGKPDTFNGIGVLDAKQIHCDEAPSVDVIKLFDYSEVLLDTITIHQVPEPATIALLGLGGLLLRRRK